MANKPTTEVEVDLSADGAQLTRVVEAIGSKIERILGSVSKINKESSKGAIQFENKMERIAQQLMKSMGTMQKLADAVDGPKNNTVRNLNRTQNFAADTVKATKFAGTLASATNAADALEARLNSLNKKIAEVGKDGLASRADLGKRLGLENLRKELSAVERDLNKMDARARRTGGDFSGARGGVTSARDNLTTALSDPRRSNFTSEIAAYADAAARYSQTVADARTQQAKLLREERLTRGESLSIQKELGRQTVRDAVASGSLGKVQADNDRRKLALVEQLKTAKGAEARLANNNLQIEKAITAEIKSQTAELKRRQSADKPPAAPAGGGGSSILPAGGIGTVLARTGAYGGAAALLYGVVGSLRDGVKFALEFEDTLRQLQAISGATDTQMGSLANRIVEVAGNSRFATIELVEASTALAQAGFSAQGIGTALQAASNLASASGSTIKESVDLITSAIGSFQLGEEEATRVSDALVAALNRSKLTVQQVAQGIQYAGATAFEQNISFEELTATMGALAQAGIRSGSTIGTGLRQFLVDLQSPSEKLSNQLRELGLTFQQVDVATLGLPAVLNNLKAAGFGSAEAYGALETRAAAAYLVLKNNVDVINKIRIAEAQNGVAAEAAGKAVDSFAAQWQITKNNLNAGVSESIGGITGMLKEQLKSLNEFNSNDYVKMLREQRDEGKLTEEQYARSISMYYDSRDAFRESTGALTESLEAGTSKAGDLRAEVDKSTSSLFAIDEAIERVVVRQGSLKVGSSDLAAETASLASRFGGLAQYVDAANNSVGGLIGALQKLRAEESQTLSRSLFAGQLQAGQNASNLYRQATNNQGVDGNFGGGALPANVRKARDDLARDPKNVTLQQRLSFAASKMAPGAQRDRVRGYVQSVAAAGVQKDEQRDYGTRLSEVAYSATRGGTAMLNQVGNLANKSPAEVKRVLAQLGKALADPSVSRDPGAVRFVSGLIERAQSYQGADGGFTPVKPTKATKAKGAGAAARAERQQQGREKFVSQTAFKTAEMDLKDALATGEDPKTLEAYQTSRDAIETSLSEWVTARFALMEEEIDSKKLDGEEEALFRREIGEQVILKQRDAKRQIAENFAAMADAQIKAAETAYEDAIRPIEMKAKIADGRRASLDRLDVRDRVPDYVRANADRAAERAKEESERARVPALNQLAGAYESAIGTYEEEIKNGLAANGNKATAAIADMQLKLIDLKGKLAETRGEVDLLNVSFEGITMLPTGLGDAFNQAIEAYRNAQGMNRTFAEEIQNNLGGAIAAVGAEFTTFFETLITKPGQALAAFGNMAKGIIRAMGEMAAQAIAKQIFSIILNVLSSVGGAKAPTGSSGGMDLRGFSYPTGFGSFHGGPVQRFARGGMVENGVSSRDSVMAMLAKDEFVVRKSAADSLGPKFLNDLNNRGARALEGLGKTPAMPAPAMQSVKVYVVAPEEKPQMSENDILVAIQRDVLKGGSTKQLIKHVAQGG